MGKTRRIVHILDDLAMGGVTRALGNFADPRLAGFGEHVTLDLNAGLPRAHSRADIAVLHFTMNWRKLAQLVKLRALGGFSRVILIEHTYTEGFEAACVPRSGRFHRMLSLAYGLCDQVVCVSQAQRDWMLETGLASPQKLYAIPQSRACGDLLDLPLPERREGPLRIGAFGRFHQQKGFDLLLEAMTEIPIDIAELTIAGQGPEAARLKAMALNLPHVQIAKPFTSPMEFLSGVDLVAIPSRWEAFGLVGTEARASGRPLIAADIDGLRDQVGRHSFTHRAGDVADLRRAILEANQAHDLAGRSRLARAHVRGEYDAMIDGWAQLLAPASMKAAQAA
ncbi:MAG: glycosyltransferase family 4 protein [Hyphomonadaceae bacterium]|nr:glycosyltransferase family 4 protein [Hyphomonadaceae bacterium]